MPYVLRDASNKIIRASVRTPVGSGTLPHNHPDIIEFLKSRQQDPAQIEEALTELRNTDIEMSRAIEDVIMVLLKKNVQKMSDLPRQVQDRMALRTKLRTRIEDAYEKASKVGDGTRPGAPGAMPNAASLAHETSAQV